MKRSIPYLVVGVGLALASTARADKHEVMTDRCSDEVAFVPEYNDKPTAHGTVILKRDPKTGVSPWTTFSAKLGSDGHVRWWCHSTKGNVFDAGTWRVKVDGKNLEACLVAISGDVMTIGGASGNEGTCKKSIKIGSSAFDGWTPEQSRCGDHSTKFRARLGKDRLLETECLGK